VAVASLLLRGLELLQSAPAPELESLATQISLQEFARRQVVYQKGDPAQALYFVLSGRLQAVDFTVDAREVGLFFAEPGQHFGEMAMLDTAPREETIIALGPTKVLRLDAVIARDFLVRQPGAAWGLLEQMAQRLRRTALQRRLLALPHPAQRVGAQLLELLSVSPEPGPAGPRIDPMPTHQELAIMINASRETVTRVFQQLQNRNWVQRDGHALVLLDVEAVRGLAQNGPVDW
jgi:CRP/FNR family cyclic AMP-dependent transcriptional regulator